MRIYSLEDGTLIRVLKTPAEFDQFGAPGSYTWELELDSATNPAILNHIDKAWNDVRLVDGVLTYKGAEVAVNPPGQAWIERARQEQADSDAANIPNWATWNVEQALDWHDANIATPIEGAPTVTAGNAVAVLNGLLNTLRDLENENRALVRMVLALRNKTWPGLEGS